MIIIGPFTHNFGDSVWECNEYGGQLCHAGLQAALNTELETSNSYELRIYPKRPRGDVSELKLSCGDGYAEEVEDEYGEVHELDWQLGNVITDKFGELEDKDNKITFYVRPLDLGPAPKVIDDAYFNEFQSRMEFTAEDGSTAFVEVDLATLTWS